MALITPSDIRRHNLATVLKALHAEGPTRQVELSDSLALRRATAISVVDELQALGLVTEVAPGQRGGRGRPSRTIAPSPNVVVLSVELASEHVRVGLVALGGEVRRDLDLPVTPGELRPQDMASRIVTAALGERIGSSEEVVVGVGIAVHGALDAAGRVVLAPNLRWDIV